MQELYITTPENMNNKIDLKQLYYEKVFNNSNNDGCPLVFGSAKHEH